MLVKVGWSSSTHQSQNLIMCSSVTTKYHPVQHQKAGHADPLQYMSDLMLQIDEMSLIL